MKELAKRKCRFETSVGLNMHIIYDFVQNMKSYLRFVWGTEKDQSLPPGFAPYRWPPGKPTRLAPIPLVADETSATRNRISAILVGLLMKALQSLPPGKPTRLAPIPKPAPWRAVAPMLGLTTSRMANTAAATTPSVTISSQGRR